MLQQNGPRSGFHYVACHDRKYRNVHFNTSKRPKQKNRNSSMLVLVDLASSMPSSITEQGTLPSL